MYKWAKLNGYVKKNPFDDIDAKRLPLYNVTQKPGKKKAFVCGEHLKIMDAAMTDFKLKPHPAPLAIILTFYTGLRIGEVVALKWEDVEWENHKLLINRYEEDVVDFDNDFKGFSNYHYVIYDCDTKGSFGSREVFLTDEASQSIYILYGFFQNL